MSKKETDIERWKRLIDERHELFKELREKLETLIKAPLVPISNEDDEDGKAKTMTKKEELHLLNAAIVIKERQIRAVENNYYGAVQDNQYAYAQRLEDTLSMLRQELRELQKEEEDNV